VIASADARYVLILRVASVSDQEKSASVSGARHVDKCELKPLGSTENGARFALRGEQHGLCVILTRLAEPKVTSCVAVENSVFGDGK
jgi:hypothetical protein